MKLMFEPKITRERERRSRRKTLKTNKSREREKPTRATISFT